ncbi:MAG TPA: hypothetical protein VL475_02435, partial [Planctomycetaceae bacterium]|nr:hypothetical protein [Planctomycetaceae bacterium]
MRKPATKKQIVTSLGLLAAVAAAGWWWWPHIRFRFQLARNNVHIRSVPVSELKAPGQFTGWYDCRLGPVSLRLPPALADKAERSVDKMSIVFTAPEEQLTVVLPVRIKAEDRARNQKMADEFKLSPTRMLAESFRSGTDDFRWWMTHAELRRHQMLLAMKATNFPNARIMGVETRYDPRIEGVLVRGDRQTAMFQWQSTSGVAFGTLVFTKKEGPLDFDMVRDVCQSLACNEEQLYERQYSKK